MQNWLHRQLLIADTETTSLRRDSGIHAISWINPQTNQISEWFTNPYTVDIVTTSAQDRTRLATTDKDIYTYNPASSWYEVRAREVERVVPGLPDPMAAEPWVNPWQARAAKENRYPYMTGGDYGPERAAGFARQGWVVSSAKGDIGDALKALPKGHTIWFANAAFDNKVVGSVLASRPDINPDFVASLQTRSASTADPFYVTGKQVQAARARAQMTGDWTQVYRAYRDEPIDAGATAIRDIQDVIRAIHSYGKKSGMYKGDIYTGTSVDIASRLMLAASANTAAAQRAALTMQEFHGATEDSLQQLALLRKSLGFAEALDAVETGTELGKRLLDAAKEGRGELANVSRYFKMLEHMAPVLQEAYATQRLVRAALDIDETGESWQHSGFDKVRWVKQITNRNEVIESPVGVQDRLRFETVDEVAEYMKKHGEYGHTDVDALLAEIKGLTTGSRQENLRALNTYMEGRGAGRLSAWFEANQEKLIGIQAQDPRNYASTARRAFDLPNIRPYAGKALPIALATGAMIFGSAIFNPTEQTVQPSLVATNYKEWLAHQEPAQEGLIKGGRAAEARPYNTDFASPYRGPVISNIVLADQELLREREAWQRQKYGAQHWDPEFGVMGFTGPFKDFWKLGRQGYRFIPDVAPVSASDYGLRGNNLLGVDLSRYKISAEDADTITLSRRGPLNALKGFFGMNEQYTVRLAGIDAPEIAHGNKPAQPYSAEATKALEGLIAQGDLQLVIDPNNVSYGRAMGVLFAGDKNVSHELVKRGSVAALPYGKQSEAMIDYQALLDSEARVAASQRGLFSTPWGQVVHQFALNSDHGVTFNTLANAKKVAERGELMNLATLANHAEALGMANTNVLIAAADAGANYRGQIRNDFSEGTPFYSSLQSQPHYQYMTELQRDLTGFIQNKGSVNNITFKSRSGFGQLNGYMALDTMGTTNSIWNKPDIETARYYRVSTLANRERKARQAELQRRVNQQFNSSPIGHHVM